MSINEMFQSLELELAKRKMLVGTAGGKISDIISALKSQVFAKLDEAGKIINNRTLILQNADASAKEIIKDAKAEASNIVDEQGIVISAQQKAEDMLTIAASRDSKLRQDFAIYINAKLLQCENAVMDMLTKFREDRNKIIDE